MTPAPIAALALSLALSQASPAAPAALPVLTLEDALARAGSSNLDLKAAEARLDQARAGVGKAWSFQLPQVTAGASWTHNSDESTLQLPVGYAVRQRDGGADEPAPLTDPDLPGAEVPGPNGPLFVTPAQSIEATLQKRDQLGAQVQVNQALLAPGVWFGIRAANKGAALAEKSVDAARRDVLFGVAQVYYAVTSLKKLVEVS
jgi:outer membrane protein TolC